MEKIKIHWIHGKAGTGKTYLVNKLIQEKINNWEVEKSEISMLGSFNGRYWLEPIKSYTKILIDDFVMPKKKDELNAYLNVLRGEPIYIKMEGYVHTNFTDIYIQSLYTPEEILKEYVNEFNIIRYELTHVYPTGVEINFVNQF